MINISSARSAAGAASAASAANTPAISHEEPDIESVVELSREVGRGRGSEGRLVVRGKLGPGIVRQIGTIGGSVLVRVHWPSAELDTWVDSGDLEQADRRARLLSIYRYDAGGYRTLDRCKVIAAAGLNYNWTVELFPENVIRTERSDGVAWTFDWYPIVQRAQPHGTLMEDALAEDAHAEALTVAELSTS
jgi:hypothetical protein